MNTNRKFYRPDPACSVPRVFLMGELVGRRMGLTPGWDTFFPGRRHLVSEGDHDDPAIGRQVHWRIESLVSGIVYCSIFEATPAELGRFGYGFPLSAPDVLVTIEQLHGNVGADSLSSEVLHQLHLHGVAAEVAFGRLASQRGGAHG